MALSFVTPFEQLQLELINRARLDPEAEAARLGITLNEGLATGTISGGAKQILSGGSNSPLHDAAFLHTNHMINVDMSGHEGIGDGTLASRLVDSGITGTTAIGENIAATSGSNETLNAVKLYELLFKDVGIAGRGHRLNLLNNNFNEVGIAQLTGVFTPTGTGTSTVVTQDFIKRGSLFVSGVVYNDTNNNHFYDIGEKLSTTTIISLPGFAVETATSGSGGYDLEVENTVNQSVNFKVSNVGPGVTVTVRSTSNENIKVDLVNGNAIYTSGNATLGVGAVNLTLLGINGLTGVGNSVGNVIEGTRGGNVLYGFDGADTLKGMAGNDVLHGGNGIDRLEGGKGNDILTGGANADILDGGDDFDMASYQSPTATTGVMVYLDIPGYNTGEALGDSFVSIENLSGTNFLDRLVGTEGSNTLWGNGGIDLLYGYGGSDNLRGGTGNDKLFGGNGIDILIGGADADILDGGPESDTASYDEYTTTAGVYARMDRPDLNTGEAKGDTYIAIENLTGTKFVDILVGNQYANELRGLAGADLLYGLAGADTLRGSEGNDLLEGGAAGDLLDGGFDFDFASYQYAGGAVTASVANQSVNLGDAAGDFYISIEGLGGSYHGDTLIGDAKGNIINGSLGNDTLTGGLGPDAFVFSTTLNGTTNVDTITDFSVVDDVMWLENTGIFAKLTATGVLGAANFRAASAALDADDYILYNQSTGDIFYDADGNGSGAAIKFTHVNANTALTNLDFLVV